MAKIWNKKEVIKLNKYQLKEVALRYVHEWANLNSPTTDEDFYDSVRIEHLRGTSDNDNRLIEFTQKEKEIMRREFEVIDNWLRKRKLKYLKLINDEKAKEN